LVDVERSDYSEEAHTRVNIAIADEQPVNVELLYPNLGIDEALTAAADRFHLDAEALIAAARAALAAPDRIVILDLSAGVAA
jgi:hypothetical protein